MLAKYPQLQAMGVADPKPLRVPEDHAENHLVLDNTEEITP
jgi:hypothetical protein